MKKTVSCEDIQRNIPAFIGGNMESKDTLSFIRHIRTCKTCMEELSVEYLVLVGVKRLDSASAFNLNKELDDLLTRNENRAKRKRNVSVIVFIAAILLAVIGGYFLSGIFY